MLKCGSITYLTTLILIEFLILITVFIPHNRALKTKGTLEMEEATTAVEAPADVVENSPTWNGNFIIKISLSAKMAKVMQNKLKIRLNKLRRNKIDKHFGKEVRNRERMPTPPST